MRMEVNDVVGAVSRDIGKQSAGLIRAGGTLAGDHHARSSVSDTPIDARGRPALSSSACCVLSAPPRASWETIHGPCH